MHIQQTLKRKDLKRVEAMSEVKWIKIVTDIFDDEKMLLIDGLPEHDAIIVIWFKLLCFAGKQNNGGVFIMNNKIAYTDEMLATIFRRPLDLVQTAFEIFKQYGMIEIYNGTITIPNWEKHQSLEALETTREQTRKRVAKHRAKQKKVVDNNNSGNGDVTECNVTVTKRNGNVMVTEEDKEIDIEEDLEIEKERDKEKDAAYISIYPSIMAVGLTLSYSFLR